MPVGARLHAAGVVRVTMHDGLVSVSAKGATLSEILDAWARAGQTEIVNTDKITSTAPLTLELTDVREDDALDVLLNSLGGYLGVTRPVVQPNTSRFARIVITASSVPASAAAVLNAPVPSQVAPPPQQSVIVNGVARLIGPGGALVEDDQEGAPAPMPRAFSRGDGAPGMPPAQPVAGPAPAVVGSAAPGVIVPPPQQNTPAPVATPQR
jgi:hypothetical protein